MPSINSKLYVLAFLALTVALFAGCHRYRSEQTPTPRPTATATQTPTPTSTEGEVELRVQVFASGLIVPWDLAFTNDNRIFVTERTGRLRVILNGALQETPVATISDVAPEGEGGLLGLALDPNFSDNGWLYLYYTYRADGELRNRVVRYMEENNQLKTETRQILVDGIPGSSVHNGGRIVFGPDGKLYITTGDAAEQSLAQDTSSLAGKILRIDADGSIPDDNPFAGSPVYSYGHRNPQGIAWQPGTGRLYETEHGPTGNDEVNLIEPGKNYGWPVVQDGDHTDPYVAPLTYYPTAIAPSGASFYDSPAIPQWRGSMLFATLRGTHLHRITIDPNDPRHITSEEVLYNGQYGRLREVAQGPDGALYVTTNNRDGRGSPIQGDDRILRILPR